MEYGIFLSIAVNLTSQLLYGDSILPFPPCFSSGATFVDGSVSEWSDNEIQASETRRCDDRSLTTQTIVQIGFPNLVLRWN